MNSELLLDTHIWFWFATPSPRLKSPARHHGLRLINGYQKILDYARQGYLRAHATDDKELLES
ncbi:hypothetical protein [Thiolapillus sp.]